MIRRFLLGGACLGDGSEVQVVGFLLGGLGVLVWVTSIEYRLSSCWVVGRVRVDLYE